MPYIYINLKFPLYIHLTCIFSKILHIYKGPSKTEKSPRQIRHLHYISQFTSDIRNFSGKLNVVADTFN